VNPRILLVGAALAQILGGAYWLFFAHLTGQGYGGASWIEFIFMIVVSVPLAFGSRLAFWCSVMQGLVHASFGIWGMVNLAPGSRTQTGAPEPPLVGGAIALLVLLLLVLGRGGLRLDMRPVPPPPLPPH
jgi:hypothetical protein